MATTGGQTLPSKLLPGDSNGDKLRAEWFRCDLHMHSGYDRPNFTDQPITGNTTAFHTATDHDLHGHAIQFIEACDAADNGNGLDIVAITDHNTIEGFKRLKPHFAQIRAQRERNGHKCPVVLPGVEITVGTERLLHLLVIFAFESDPKEIEGTIRHIFGPHECFDQHTNTPRPAQISIAEFFKKLYEYAMPESRERDLQFLVIPAHITSKRGIAQETWIKAQPSLWSELSGYLRQTVLTNKNWHGFQTAKPFKDLPNDLRELLCHWMAVKENKTWDELKRQQRDTIRARLHWPLIEASDPHHLTDIGNRFTWMKMGIRDLEGVRLALLDPESRLRRMEPGQPNLNYAYIESIVVKNTDFYEDIRVQFSPSLTTIIGGRGTGKSTLIEYIRYGLNRTKGSDFSEVTAMTETKKYVDSLLSQKSSRDYGQTRGTLLDDSTIEIEVVVPSHVYRITKSPREIQISPLTATDAKPIDFIDVRALIAPKIISQKQIAEIARTPAALRTELDSLIDAIELRSIRDQIQGATERLMELQNKRRRLDLDQAKLPSLETELHTLNDQIAIMEDAGNRSILSAVRHANERTKWLQSVRTELEQLATELEDVSEQIEDTKNWSHVSQEEDSTDSTETDARSWVISIDKEVRDVRQRIASELKENAHALRSLRMSIQRKQGEIWEPYCQSVNSSYKDIERELAKQGVGHATYEQLIQRRSSVEKQIANVSARIARIAENDREIEASKAHMINLHGHLTSLREDRASFLKKTNADIRLKILQFRDRAEFESNWVQWFGGSGVREQHWTSICDYIFEFPAEIPVRISRVSVALREDIRATSMTGNVLPSNESSLADLIGSGLDGHFFRALLKGEQIQVDHIERSLPSDLVVGQVRGPGGNFRSIETSSIGQRSTAILSLLLSSGCHPIILDQPEDDLDNQYVYNVVVDLLRRKKFSRQIIVATHNANIPVNGDAESIVALGVENQSGTVRCQGSIDDPRVKESVSLIMEGSDEAFRRRLDRYGF